ncbi:voltage-dependent calcium channel gamma-8 subunit-like [Uloborus diversus]|uniref:voltage-dependent calcium channel gamma-8 subunit-like n=1 Tax=Uloborus diversus TaxID=327109 RepID=UPI002409DC6C|nr:voltage-dependent calcium channel gamma-8 subunit-like [Uloborus diversus]
MSGREKTQPSNPDEQNQKRTRKASAMQRIRKRVANRDPAAVLVFERKLLVAATAGLILAFILWTVAVSTDFWFHVSSSDGTPIYMNRTNSFFVRSHSGLWTICKYIHANGTLTSLASKNCHNHRLFPTTEFLQKNPEVDRTILDYTRTETAFAIISFCLIAMGFGFSVYTFKEPRYMFKRLAGVVHFISAGAVLVVIEVVVNSVQYEEQFLQDRHPKGAIWSYGYSFAVAWMTFVVLVACGATFLICSGKKKGDRATQSNDDEPHILGRM